MSYVIRTQKFRAADNHVYEIEITIATDAYSVVENHHLTELDSFTIGSSNYSDTIFYPSNVSFSITIAPHTDRFAKWLLIFKLLTSNDTTANVKRDNQDYFWGKIYPKETKGDKDGYILQLTIVDPIGDLKSVNPRTDFPHINGSEVDFIRTIIYELVKSVHPKFTSAAQVLLPGHIEGQSSYLQPFNSEYYVTNLSNFGTFNSSVFGESGYRSGADALKAILTSFGLIGVFGFGNRFYVLPRYLKSADGVTVVNLTKLEKQQEIIVVRRQQGLRIYVYTGANSGPPDYNKSYQVKDHGSIVLKDGNIDRTEVEELFIDCPAGSLPITGSFKNLYIWVPGFVAGIGEEHWSIVRNGVRFVGQSSFTSLWNLTGSATWELIKKNRYGHIVTTTQEVNPQDIMRIYGSMDNYRVKQLEADPAKRYKLKIVECGIP